MRLALVSSTLMCIVESYFMNAPLNLGEKPILPPIRTNSTHAVYFYDGVFRYELLHPNNESITKTNSTLPTEPYLSSVNTVESVKVNSPSAELINPTSELERSTEDGTVKSLSFNADVTFATQLPVEITSISDDRSIQSEETTLLITSSLTEDEQPKTTEGIFEEILKTEGIFEQNNENILTTMQTQQQQEAAIPIKRIPEESSTSEPPTSSQSFTDDEPNYSFSDEEFSNKNSSITLEPENETAQTSSTMKELTNETADDTGNFMENGFPPKERLLPTLPETVTSALITKVTPTTMTAYANFGMKSTASTDSMPTTIITTSATYMDYTMSELDTTSKFTTDIATAIWRNGFPNDEEMDKTNETQFENNETITNVVTSTIFIDPYDREQYLEKSTHLPIIKRITPDLSTGESDYSTEVESSKIVEIDGTHWNRTDNSTLLWNVQLNNVTIL